ncbi:MAG: hypothetical protein R3C59_25975 [Planctomycetaceae bacterium]
MSLRFKLCLGVWITVVAGTMLNQQANGEESGLVPMPIPVATRTSLPADETDLPVNETKTIEPQPAAADAATEPAAEAATKPAAEATTRPVSDPPADQSATAIPEDALPQYTGPDYSNPDSVRAQSAPNQPVPTSPTPAQPMQVLPMQSFPPAMTVPVPQYGTPNYGMQQFGVPQYNTPQFGIPQPPTADEGWHIDIRPSAKVVIERHYPDPVNPGYDADPNVVEPCEGCGRVQADPQRYMKIYSTIPFNRSEYDVNPSYRHDATMEILTGNARHQTIVRHTSASSQPVTTRPVMPYSPVYNPALYGYLRPGLRLNYYRYFPSLNPYVNIWNYSGAF